MSDYISICSIIAGTLGQITKEEEEDAYIISSMKQNQLVWQINNVTCHKRQINSSCLFLVRLLVFLSVFKKANSEKGT